MADAGETWALWELVKGWPWKEIAPWAGIGISLLWNLANTLLTSRAWRRNQNFAEFRSLKPPIDLALGKLRETRKKLQSTESYGGDLTAFDEAIKPINKEMVDNYISLITALEACDVSDHWQSQDLAQSELAPERPGHAPPLS